MKHHQPNKSQKENHQKIIFHTSFSLTLRSQDLTSPTGPRGSRSKTRGIFFSFFLSFFLFFCFLLLFSPFPVRNQDLDDLRKQTMGFSFWKSRVFKDHQFFKTKPSQNYPPKEAHLKERGNCFGRDRTRSGGIAHLKRRRILNAKSNRVILVGC
jgi:hypothetical protein